MYHTNNEIQITDWLSHDKCENSSDHNTIKKKTQDNPRSVRHLNKAKWDTFTSALLYAEFSYPKLITQKILDSMVQDLCNKINHALNISMSVKSLCTPKTKMNGQMK